MDFFRRIFGNASDDSTAEPEKKTSQDQVDTLKPEETDADVASEKMLDPATVDALQQTAEAGEDTTDDADALSDSLETAPVSFAAGVTRPLPAETVNLYQPYNGHLTFGQSSDQGMVRNNNQDSALSFFFTGSSVDEIPDFGLFVVADGMGGHQEGEKASALTIRVVGTYVIRSIYLSLLNNAQNTGDNTPISEKLIHAVKMANSEVIQEVPDGGTTVTAVLVMGNLAHIAHVGDSRAYYITKNGIEKITRDHSLVQRLIELNQLTPEEAETHKQRNVLYRAIGQNEELEVDTLTRRLTSDTYLLLCSDGLWGLIDDDEIHSIVTEIPDPQQACDKLIARANANGGHDNITAVLLKMPGSKPAEK